MEFGAKWFNQKYLTGITSAKYLSHIKLVVKKQFNNVKLSLTVCDLCGGVCQHYLLLCEHCFNDLPLFKMDVVNGDLLNWPAINRGVSDHQFDHLISLAPHLWPFDHWVAQFKYHGRFELGDFFAHLLSDQWQLEKRKCSSSSLSDNPPNAIMAVPIHIKKWQQRGFNQTHLIAKPLSDRINIPYLSEGLIRTRSSEQQVGKTGALRRKSLLNAFEVATSTKVIWQDDEPPEHILLIDDVVTTGTTANEICKLLKQEGVKKVTLLTISLSLPS